MKATIQDANFVTIQGWVINQLGLTSNEAIVYALVYGFPEGFDKPISYIAQWIGSSERTTQRLLQRLIRDGFIKAELRTGKSTSYTCIPPSNCHPRQIVTPDKNDTNPRQFVTPIYNNYNNIIDCVSTRACAREEEKKGEAAPRFKKPTVDEIAAYCAERNNSISAGEFYDFYESKGWLVGKTPMKDWKACVRTWERRRQNENNQNNKQYATRQNNTKFADIAESMSAITAGINAAITERRLDK